MVPGNRDADDSQKSIAARIVRIEQCAERERRPRPCPVTSSIGPQIGKKERNYKMSEILSSTFVLAVKDLETSKRFYLDKLGFAEDFSVEGWAFLSRGGCHLRLGHCPDALPMSKAQDHSWFAYLHVRDASGLYEETVKNGVEIWHKLADKPWGMREFAVVTPDGHRIVFGERLPI
jgi:catechol 2,3-dioxygenase-like lactoylglutathione lyase family enzyme